MRTRAVPGRSMNTRIVSRRACRTALDTNSETIRAPSSDRSSRRHTAHTEPHAGEALLSLDDLRAALPHLQRSAEAARGGGRREFGTVLAELTALVQLGAWRDAEAPLLRLEPILRAVTSSRTRVRLRSTLRAIDRDAPSWLADTAREVTAAG